MSLENATKMENGTKMGAPSGEMVGKLYYQAFASELESQWVTYSFGLVLYLSKKFSKLQKNRTKLMRIMCLGSL